MRLLLYTDVHWSESSSIVRGRTERYSVRLENLINSVNWAELQSVASNCDAVVCLGDFFDKPTLTAEEITALKEIRWSDMPHYFLVGNHDANVSDLSFASTFALNLPNFNIISYPVAMPLDDSTVYFLPYLLEGVRRPLNDYVVDDKSRHTIILSHNDLAGVNYGGFVSTNGFGVEEILSCCDLFINGHLHNSGFVDNGEKILNLGNLSGQNFSEDAFNHRHYCAVLDTNTLKLDFIENPYAFNFYKLSLIDDVNIPMIGPNAVLSIQCSEGWLETVKKLVNEKDIVVASRVQTILTNSGEEVDISALASTDHLQQFSDYILEHIDNSDILKEELSYIMRG